MPEMRQINPGVPIAIIAMERDITRLECRDLETTERHRIRYHAFACMNAMALAWNAPGGFTGDWKRLDGLIQYIISATEPTDAEQKARRAMH